MHKWCEEKNFKILMSTKKSMLKSCKKMCLLSPLYLSSWMKKDNFKKGTQFRKVLSKENISTSSFKIHFDFMFNEIKNIWSAHFTLPVPLHSLTDTYRFVLHTPTPLPDTPPTPSPLSPPHPHSITWNLEISNEVNSCCSRWNNVVFSFNQLIVCK